MKCQSLTSDFQNGGGQGQPPKKEKGRAEENLGRPQQSQDTDLIARSYDPGNGVKQRRWRSAQPSDGTSHTARGRTARPLVQLEWDETGVGCLNQYFPAEATESEESGDGRIVAGFCHSRHGYEDRITGYHPGGQTGYVERELRALWAQACNDVQWAPGRD